MRCLLCFFLQNGCSGRGCLNNICIASYGVGVKFFTTNLMSVDLPQNTPKTRKPIAERTSHRWLGCAVLPQNSQNTQNLAAWVWQGCHTLLHLCASVSSVGGSSLSEVSVRSVRSVGASSPLVRLVQQRQLHPLAESTEVVCKSHHLTISPPHHLSHLEPSLLHVLPVLWVRLRHHLRLVDAQPREHDCRRCERHRHAVVVVRVDRL